MNIRDMILNIIAVTIPLLFPNVPVPQHDSVLTGHMYYLELIDTENEGRFHNVARMNKPTFFKLFSMS